MNLPLPKRVVDLTQEIYNGMPVYPGHQRTSIFFMKTHEETKKLYAGPHTSATMGLLLSDHGPTHTDGLNHIDSSPDAASIDQFPIEMFMTEAICLDVSDVKPEEHITADKLRDVLRKTGLAIPKGGTVLLYTGHYNRNYPGDEWLFTYTGLDYDGMMLLAEGGAVNVGIDAPSIDHGKEMKEKQYPAHRVCRERKVLNTENMANLDQVANQRFVYVGLPLRIRGGTGSPVRAAALIY